MEEANRGPAGNLLHLPLPSGAGGDEYLKALREKALPFLLEQRPNLFVVCAGYDALEVDPLATMRLKPHHFGESVKVITEQFHFPPQKIMLGLEGGYNLCPDEGMPAALVHTCAALIAE
mmetsp:Transcript_23412/g.58147  ORF Transcript_23412/g.58147 Transcript_23412/m.58147 type:complete len:119 (-) Transcript_23412:56-412(-)